MNDSGRGSSASKPQESAAQSGSDGDARDRMLSETGRYETETERYDRNFRDLQQELRITQTGTQLLAGFLLTLPFQERFEDLTTTQVTTYLVLVVLAASVSILALTPVSTHRLLFQRQQMDDLVHTSNRILIICLVASSVLFAGTVLLIFDVVLNERVGTVTGIVLFLATAALWIGVPLRLRRRGVSKERSS
jgi:hypothetical protein